MKSSFQNAPNVCLSTEKRLVSNAHDVVEIVKSLKTLGAKIVLTQGSYDLVHIGHARYLETAKSKGDVLIVGVDEDKKIRARKGPERPIVPEDERMEMVLHLRPVDIAVLKKQKDPKWHLIKLVRPDVLVATKETYTKSEIKQLKKYCGKIIVMERMATTSTSAKIRHLQIKTANKLERSLTPKLMKTIQDAIAGMRNG
ncbi:adenylyltransferase/cytidyltransferase family protein [Patescibacteria group bacterium]|nr:adenylyltransferase/cytidyltransferase family protein [Patescibacteria group bacterium]